MGKKSKKGAGASNGNVILVTGGSGFVGQKLVKRLAEKGNTVVSMYRHRLPEPMPNVYPVCSDLESIDLLKAPLRGVDAVIYLAWDHNFSSPSSEGSQGIEELRTLANTRQLVNMLRAMEHVGTPKIIFVSANGASRHSPHRYLREKYAGEFEVINSSVKQKIVMRPTILFDQNANRDLFLRSIINIAKLPGVYPVPKIDSKLSPLHVNDFCRALDKACRVEFDGEIAILDLIGKENYPIEEVFKLVSERYCRGHKFQIRGRVGNSLVDLLEKTRQAASNRPNIRHFLSVGHGTADSIQQANPISQILSHDLTSFRKSISEK